MNKKILRVVLMLAMAMAMTLGTAMMVSAQNGFTITATLDNTGSDGLQHFFAYTVEFAGEAENSGILRLAITPTGFAGDYNIPRTMYFAVSAGDTLEPVEIRLRSLSATGNAVEEDISFFEGPSATPVNGITAVGEFGAPNRSGAFPLVVTLSGAAIRDAGAMTASGTYTVYVATGTAIEVSPSEAYRFTLRNNRRIDSTVVYMVSLPTGYDLNDVTLTITFTPSDFITVDYVRETIFFDDDAVWALVSNKERFTDPARLERNLSRVRWQATRSGEIDISRMIPRRAREGRTVSIIVRRTGDVLLEDITFVDLAARPDVRAHRGLRREIYDIENSRFRNTTTANMCIRFDADVNHDTFWTLAAGATFDMHPDEKPAGIRGTFRVAANPAESTFASQPVRFRTRPQPNAPNAARIGIGERRISRVNTYVINGVTARMVVRSGAGNEFIPIPARNMPLADFYELFNGNLQTITRQNAAGENVDSYVFEFRFPAPANNRRPISRPGFVVIPVETLYATGPSTAASGGVTGPALIVDPPQ